MHWRITSLALGVALAAGPLLPDRFAAVQPPASATANSASRAGARRVQAHDTIEAVLAPYLEMGWFSGSVLVARDGEVLFSRGYGMADADREVPNAAGTVYPIGAITQTFTAAAVMQLQERGLLSVEDPVSKHLPGWPASKRDITLHHLLTHTSGLPDVLARLRYRTKPWEDPLEVYREVVREATSLGELVARVRDEPLESWPGETYTYSEPNYQVLAAIIEAVSGRSYSAYLRQHILEPLGLERTRPADEDGSDGTRAVMYSPTDSTELPPFEFSNVRGSADLVSSTRDLHQWVSALFAGEVLSPESVEAVVDDHARTPSYGTGNVRGERNAGYGWYETAAGRYRDRSAFSDLFRLLPAYHPSAAALSHYPREDLTVVVLGNRTRSGTVRALGRSIAAALQGWEYDAPEVYRVAEEPPRNLEGYAHDYTLGFPPVTLSIEMDGDHLLASTNAGVPMPIFPASDTLFFSRRGDLQWTFDLAEDGEVVGVTPTAAGRPLGRYEPIESREPVIEPVAADRFADVEWREVARDRKNDGRAPWAPDARALSYAYDRTTDSLWIRVDLHHGLNPDNVGLNLVVDSDADQETGEAWTGGNTGFTYDRVVAVWINRASFGFVGEVGIADGESFRDNELTSLAENNVTLAIDREREALIAGFPLADLDADGRMNLIAAVGQSVTWNDDIPDEGYATLNLEPR